MRRERVARTWVALGGICWWGIGWCRKGGWGRVKRVLEYVAKFIGYDDGVGG